ncbi:uncharacterized protein F4812DRAFT_214875 [Daldinia caldariorum]|uniref:uncharacterized protein n=1 Tax=Daldinia caldariorum TaxID=326644 RepID=UPI0020080B27|nr:uncharacterized protein F4812DRAFT_214875 [Daldinia caldariorum]KAI1464182.1 hypothetical protein F4812DRAFT_214875 [Daldinia caldariorum]
MKSIIAIFPLCLWHMISGTPIPPQNSPDVLPRKPLLPHVVEPIITYPRASVESIRAATRKARAGLYGSTFAARNVTLLNHTVLGTHLFERGDHKEDKDKGSNNKTIFKSTCHANVSTFVDNTRATSPLAADCSALVEQMMSEYASQSCTSFGFAPSHDNINNDSSSSSKTTTNLIAAHASCGFSITVDTAAVGRTSVGVGDVVAVIREVVRRFAVDYAVDKKTRRRDDGDDDGCGGGNVGVVNGTVGPVNSTANARVSGAGAFECGGDSGGNGTTGHGTFVNWAVVHT